MINKIKGYLLKKIYKSQYRNGHYYSPIPLIEEIEKRDEQIFTMPKTIPGIDLCDEEQVILLKEFETQPSWKIAAESTSENFYYSKNGFFNSADAYFLAAMIINKKPRKIIEIGSGFSSALMMDVKNKYFNKSLELTFIEPYPERLYGLIAKKELNIYEQFIQDIDIDMFEALEANDILFIDSSHISKVGSDVNHIIFNILPRLKKGVIVHFHDITYPFEYPKNWIYDGIFWNEAYILKSFLMYNQNFKVKLFNSYLYHFHNDWFNANIPKYNIEGGSIWLEKQ
ncbi:MAG: class I SAM-dependent methyltransferase [Fulvivirga sp.]